MSIYQVGPFQLNDERLSLTSGEESVPLGPKVVETLLVLVEHAGDVLSKEALLDRIWPEGFVEEANLSQNVYVLRKAFRRYGSADPIETVPRCGYRFTAPVRKLAQLSRAPQRAGSQLRRRIGAAISGAGFIAASLVLVASYGVGQRTAVPPRLSESGARLYLIGRYYWNLRTPEGVQRSVGYFQRVIDTDPYSSLGYAALADANVTIGDYCYGTHRPAVYFARAREFANKALALDPNSADAHAALGFIALRSKNMPGAVAELQRAISLDPSYAPAHEWYGIALLGRGRFSEGLRQLKLAADLDPLSVATTAWLGSAAYVSRRYADAIAYSRQALELSPQRTDALVTLGQAYEAQGNTARAIAAFKRYGAVGSFDRPEAAALLAHAYAIERRMPQARAQLSYARANASEVNPTDLAAAAQAVGDRSVALDFLRRVRSHGSAVENAAASKQKSHSLPD